jgi:pilus assembly protein CpaE
MADKYPLRLLVKDQNARRQLEKAVQETGRFDPQGDGFPGPLGLIVYELGEDVRKDLSRVSQALRGKRVGEVMLLSSAKDPDLLIDAMRAGVSEFITWPAPANELSEALGRFLERMDRATDVLSRKEDDGRIVHVMGAKGGVGSTTLAVNLALEHARSRKDASVALVDMHVPLGEVPMFLDLSCAYDWSEAAADLSRLDGAFLSGLMTRHESGVDVLAAPESLEVISGSGPEAVSAMLPLLRGMYDLVVVDGSPYLDDNAVRALDRADDLLLVVQLSLPCLSNAKKLISTFSDADAEFAERIRLVVNRHLSKSEISVQDAEELLGRKIFSKIENDYQGTLAAINQGKPLCQAAPKSPAAAGVRETAKRLLGPAAKPVKARKGMMSGLFRPFARKGVEGPKPGAARAADGGRA